jgi:hypothetical protein
MSGRSVNCRGVPDHIRNGYAFAVPSEGSDISPNRLHGCSQSAPLFHMSYKITGDAALSSTPPRSHATGHAAVDHQLRSRHVVGRFRGEEQHAIRDVLSLSSPAKRHPPALATSFGSIGTLRPPDPDSFAQIGVSMTPG